MDSKEYKDEIFFLYENLEKTEFKFFMNEFINWQDLLIPTFIL